MEIFITWCLIYGEVSYSYLEYIGLVAYGVIIRWDSVQVGFEMVDAIAEAEGISISSVSFKALLGKGLPSF